MKYRMVSIKEIQECPAHRLDPQHYIPHHKTGSRRSMGSTRL